MHVDHAVLALERLGQDEYADPLLEDVAGEIVLLRDRVGEIADSLLAIPA